MKRLHYYLLTSLLIFCSCQKQKLTNRDLLLDAIGIQERPKSLKLDTLESVNLSEGIRYKVEYTVTDEDTIFGFPENRIRAYLFVPNHKEHDKLPGIVAIHQYGMEKREWGKMEPSGIIGDTTLFYGLELFRRGYIVICPDGFGFGERYKLSERANKIKLMMDSGCDSNMTKGMFDLFEFLSNYPIYTLNGTSYTGINASELMSAVDVLIGLDCIDESSIGAIGHSGGGVAIVPFMLADSRIKAGISSCGFTNIEKQFHQGSDNFWDIGSPIFGLTKIGKSADLIAQIAPRAIYFTKGKWEYGNWDEDSKNESNNHVTDLIEMIDYAKKEYERYDASDNIQMNVFKENNGRHSFPEKVKEECFKWLDEQLLKK